MSAMEAEEGPDGSSEPLSESSDADDAERALRALLGTPDVGDELLSALQDELLEEGDEEELSRRVLGQILADPSVGEELLRIVEPPPVTPETCASRGWPLKAFRSCKCTPLCMRRLAASEDGPALLDELVNRMQLARAAEREREATPLPAAHSASVWLNEIEGATSAVLEAIVAEQRAEEERRRLEGHESLDAARLAVNRILADQGCCRNGRAAFIGKARNWLTYSRKRLGAGARASTSTTVARMPAEQALALPCCARGCMPVVRKKIAKCTADTRILGTIWTGIIN